jgi:PHO85 cyclin-5
MFSAKIRRTNLPPAWLVGPHHLCTQIHIYFIRSDQAVKTLSEVWRTQDIPAVFLPPPTQSATAAIKSLSQKRPLAFGDEQSLSSISESAPSIPQTPTSIPTTSNTTLASSVPANESDQLLPMRSFVHEVLRRSRTSGIVLQTALCYLEAIRSQVPNLLSKERIGIRAYYQPESRILPATEAEIAQEATLNVSEVSEEREDNDDCVNTIRVVDNTHDFDFEPKMSHEEFAPSNSATLPSPLLCPRRTFLASVILASKFSQDKCYSNRAWAKLSGLPPREIGRCERALGQALGWRLWVGKSLLSSQTPTPCSTPPLKQIARSQSESSISIQSTQSQFLNQGNCSGSADMPIPSHGRGLRKSATLPVDAFISQRQVVSSVESNSVDDQGANDTPEWISNSQVFILLF